MGQIAQIIGKVGIYSIDNRRVGKTAITPERNLAQEKIAHLIKEETLESLVILSQLYGGLGSELDILDRAREALPKTKLIEDSIAELSYFLTSVKSNEKFLESPGWDIFIDLADLDGYHYHTGIMFSLYTSEWHEAIVRGGRYEKVRTITGDSRAAVGFSFDVKKIVPYFTIFIAVMLVSKIPTLALKRISISPKTTVFLLLGIGLVFIALLFYTLETLLAFGLVYLISIPIGVILFRTQNEKNSKISEENHEDIL